MDLHAHLVESCKDCRMGVAPHASCPLPGEVSVAEHDIKMLSKVLFLRPDGEALVGSHPNASLWATSRDCQYSSGLKYVCRSTAFRTLSVRQHRNRHPDMVLSGFCGMVDWTSLTVKGLSAHGSRTGRCDCLVKFHNLLGLGSVQRELTT